MQLKKLTTPEDIALSFEAFLELRPSLSNTHSFTKQVMDQQKEGYEIIAILEKDEVVACLGFRTMTMLGLGKILYIDNLITKEKHKSKGYGKALLKYANTIAKDQACTQIHLDTGYARHAAHRMYLNQGFEFQCHHLVLKL